MEPTSVTATLNYHHPPPPGEPEPPHGIMTVASRRKKYNPQPTKIHNLRMVENKFNLDDNGFQFVTHYPSRERRWDDDAWIRERVYPEFEMLLKKRYGATHFYPMGHIIRRHSHEDDMKAVEGKRDEEIVQLQAPATFAHIDQSYDGAWSLIDRLASDHPGLSHLKEKSKKHRWAIINAWRPLKPVTREPLTLCDARTIPDTDLRPVPVVTLANADRKEYRGEIWQVAHNPRQKWYWVNEMQPDECFLIKCFDSARDGRARRAPHSAVVMPGDCGGTRKSCEIRWVVFWEGEDLEGGREEERARL